jgi:hypothetical protein
LLHVGICYKSPTSQAFLKGSKETEITKRETVTVGRAVHKLPAIMPYQVTSQGGGGPVCNPVISICLEALRGTWLSGNLQQMPMQSKLSPRHLTMISSTPGYKPL